MNQDREDPPRIFGFSDLPTGIKMRIFQVLQFIKERSAKVFPGDEAGGWKPS